MQLPAASLVQAEAEFATAAAAQQAHRGAAQGGGPNIKMEASRSPVILSHLDSNADRLHIRKETSWDSGEDTVGRFLGREL